MFLPLAPGQTFPHTLPVTDPTSYRESFRLFDVWKRGLAYVIEHNDRRSVTDSGPLFHIPALEIPEDSLDPFAENVPLSRLYTTP